MIPVDYNNCVNKKFCTLSLSPTHACISYLPNKLTQGVGTAQYEMEIERNRYSCNVVQCSNCVEKHDCNILLKPYETCSHKLFVDDGKHINKYRSVDDERRFNGNRQKALSRDLYTCQLCGKTHHEAQLDVHHLDGNGRDKEHINNDLSNLQTLCHACHTRIHKKGKKKNARQFST